ncbi:MAG: hypothetical protein ACJA2M_000335 [Polaribacter sp.]|jgi:hypothetical protein
MNKLIEYLGKNREANMMYALLYKVLSKKYYWYEVKFVYRNKNNNKILFDWKTKCGLKYQDTSLSNRRVKKIVSSLHKDENPAIKKLLCNGTLDCEIVCFLGRFNKLL